LTFLTPNERAYELSATRLQDDQGALSGVIVVFHDITRMRQFEKHTQGIRRQRQP